jgi:hypothetical protein
VRHLAVDGYYTCCSFVNGVCALQLDVIGKLRHNASLCYLYAGSQKARGRKRFRGERVQWAHLDLSLWQKEGEIERGIHLYTVVAYHDSLKRKIKVALLQRQTAKGISRTLLFSTDLELSGQDVVRFYRARFQIEFLFRDSKGSLGLEHCQSRQASAIEFHWNASLCALTLAKWQEERCVQKQRFSVVSCKRKNSNRHLLKLFSESLGMDANALKLHPLYQVISNYGVIQP